MKIVQTLIVPNHYASALVNGDLSGYESDDLEHINRIIDEIGTNTIEIGEELGFMYCSEIGLYADCIEVNVWA